MSELHDKARAMVALRDKAPAAPWRCFGTDHELRVLGGRNGYTLFRIDSGGRDAMEFAAAAHRMADLIAAQDAKIAELEAENEGLSMTNALANSTLLAIESRAETAEAAYRNVCEAEPVAYAWGGNLYWVSQERMSSLTVDGVMPKVGFIARPTMPESGK